MNARKELNYACGTACGTMCTIIYHDYVAQYDTAFVNLDLSKCYFDQLLTYPASNE